MSNCEKELKEQRIRYTKKIAQLANESSMIIGEYMGRIDKNNAKMTSFPMEFIAFAEKVSKKLSPKELELLAILSQKAIGIQKLNNENFKLIVELADMQRQRTENAIDDYKSVL